MRLYSRATSSRILVSGAFGQRWSSPSHVFSNVWSIMTWHWVLEWKQRKYPVICAETYTHTLEDMVLLFEIYDVKGDMKQAAQLRAWVINAVPNSVCLACSLLHAIRCGVIESGNIILDMWARDGFVAQKALFSLLTATGINIHSRSSKKVLILPHDSISTTSM